MPVCVLFEPLRTASSRQHDPSAGKTHPLPHSGKGTTCILTLEVARWDESRVAAPVQDSPRQLVLLNIGRASRAIGVFISNMTCAQKISASSRSITRRHAAAGLHGHLHRWRSLNVGGGPGPGGRLSVSVACRWRKAAG